MNTSSTRPRRLRRTIAALIALATAAGIGHLTTNTTTASADTINASTFVPTEPCRLLDTRPAYLIGTRTSPLGPAETLTQQVTGTNGNNCTIPTHATGVALNTTIVDPTSESYLTLSPADTTRPLAANLNWIAGQPPTPNKVDVMLSTDGAINVYNNTGSVHLVLDIFGYYTANPLPDLQQQVDDLKTQVAALESAAAPTEQLTTRLNDAEASIAANSTAIADNDTDIAEVSDLANFNRSSHVTMDYYFDVLWDRQPFVEHTEMSYTVDDKRTILMADTLTPEADGVVTAIAYVNHGTQDKGDIVYCFFNDGSGDGEKLAWTSPGGTGNGADPFATTTLTANYNVEADELFRLYVICDGTDDTVYAHGKMTLIYTA